VRPNKLSPFLALFSTKTFCTLPIDISISSDFIIGFPGENEQDFTDTMALINEVIFDKSFSFIYSAARASVIFTLTI
jgi:tRNA A37 methylthiotransferase MiaB